MEDVVINFGKPFRVVDLERLTRVLAVAEAAHAYINEPARAFCETDGYPLLAAAVDALQPGDWELDQ